MTGERTCNPFAAPSYKDLSLCTPKYETMVKRLGEVTNKMNTQLAFDTTRNSYLRYTLGLGNIRHDSPALDWSVNRAES